MATTAPPTSSFAKSPQIPAHGVRSNPLILWHLLSLDAPTVAALWAWFVARESRVPLPDSSIPAMAIAVWIVYVADRLLDGRSTDPFQELEVRHHFHRNHRRAFVCGMALAAAVLAVLLPSLGAPSLRLYAILGAMLLAYFALIHSPANSSQGKRLPKEIAVGVFFSAAIFIPTVSRQPALRLALLPAAVLFAILCTLNCLFIYAWEHPIALSSTHPAAHPATGIALRFLPSLAAAAIASGISFALPEPHLRGQVPAACALAATLLLILHRSRRHFTPLTLRAAADLCLLTPLLFLAR